MQGGFPIDLILFAMVAAFLVLRLRSVLGRRTGFERPTEGRPAAGYPPRVVEGEPVTAAPEAPRYALPDPRGPVGQALERLRGVDPGFDPQAFLGGAEGAFRMIVEGFARGDRTVLRDLLSEETWAGFEQALNAREAAGQTQRTEIRAISQVAIESAELRGTVADVTVRFVSDQVNMTLNADGSPASGTDAVTELTDLWTFQRDLRSGDPTWKLAGTRSA
ncbi:Tim44/TimA family putative adaptor protein [Roseomonas sp. BN140053]|uniref:Tim44/TimA family putative adaptor protein n=1 Tax=Roseomonas sp. BN140053 TaxID=3391898 RepID=UPI0039EBF60D